MIIIDKLNVLDIFPNSLMIYQK